MKWVTLLYVVFLYALIPLARSIQAWIEKWIGIWFNFGILLLYSAFFAAMFAHLKFIRKEKRIWPYGAVIFIGALLTYFLSHIELAVEKIHFLEYAVLGTLLLLSFRLKDLLSSVLCVLGIGFFIGLGDELIQGLVPKRFFDWRDVGMNGIGVAIGIGMAMILFPKLFHHDP